MISKNIEVTLNNIPRELIEFNQWVAWREADRKNQRKSKIPINPNTGRSARTNDPSTWGSFEEALERYQQDGLEGVGFVFSETDPFVGIDVDDCVNGEIDAEIKKLVEACNSYTEKSPSGTGIHILVKGKLQAGGRRNGNVEVYDSKRFFTVTGNHLSETPDTIADGTKAIRYLFDGPLAPDFTDEDNKIIEQVLSSEIGWSFKELWAGGYERFPSQSEADLALCQHLAFHTRDRSQIDRLFRKSKLFRNKWDETHFADGRTYGEATIEKALKSITGSRQEKAEPATKTPDFNCTDLGNAERLVL